MHRWRQCIWRAIPHAMKRSWVDDSTASVLGNRLQGLKLVLANTVAFEELEATDEAKMNGGKSGYLASNGEAVAFVEHILDERVLWAHGGVVVLGDPGPEEPAWVAEAPQLMRAAHLNRDEALVAVARASVVVVGQGGFHCGEAREVAAVAGCVVWCGQWASMDGPASAAAVEQLTRHGQECRLRMTYRKALKDLGVVQGLGKDARDLAAQRHAVLQQRSEAIAKLAVPVAKAERLVAISGIPAGLYGAAAHPPDSDTLSCMRTWVLHACYKGSRFVQGALWFVFCADSWRSDPVKVWLVKAAEACSRQLLAHGEQLVREVWESGNATGPIAGLKAILLHCGIDATLDACVAGGSVLRRPLEAAAAERRVFFC